MKQLIPTPPTEKEVIYTKDANVYKNLIVVKDANNVIVGIVAARITQLTILGIAAQYQAASGSYADLDSLVRSYPSYTFWVIT